MEFEWSRNHLTLLLLYSFLICWEILPNILYIGFSTLLNVNMSLAATVTITYMHIAYSYFIGEN